MWPVLREKNFWRYYWIALRRSRKDTRARKFFLRASFWMFYMVCWATSEFFIFRRSSTNLWIPIGDSALLGIAGIVVLWIRRSHRRQDQMFTYSFTDVKPINVSRSAKDQLRAYLIDRAAITAALLMRASSEWCLQNKELPSEIEIITRRVQNDLLRREGLWNSLEPEELTLFLSADGHWSEEQQGDVIAWCERLRLLRWTLGYDASLFRLGHFPRVDASIAKGIVERRQEFFKGKEMLAAWDVRVERDTATGYLIQCIAEIMERKQWSNLSEELGEWAHDVRKDVYGPSTDVIAGIQTLGEMDDATLSTFFSTVEARREYSSYLVDLLGGEPLLTFDDWRARRVDSTDENI